MTCNYPSAKWLGREEEMKTTPLEPWRTSAGTKEEKPEAPWIKPACWWRAKRKENPRPLSLTPTLPPFPRGVVWCCQGCAFYLAAIIHFHSSSSCYTPANAETYGSDLEKQ